MDKTKYTMHVKRKNPCKERQKRKNGSDSDDDKGGDSDEGSGSLVIDRRPVLSDVCKLCKMKYNGLYIDHLVECHDIEKDERIFSFSKKKSGLSCYENDENSGDIAIIGFADGNGFLFITTNLHNLQRHKKTKYRDMRTFTYYPCKNIVEFKKDWMDLIEDESMNEDNHNEKKMNVEWMNIMTNKILRRINEVGDVERVEKTDASYKSEIYYKCPFCNHMEDLKMNLNQHLLDSHKFLRHNPSRLELDEEQKDKLLSIIDKVGVGGGMTTIENIGVDIDCKTCGIQFPNKFALQKHMKDGCQNVVGNRHNRFYNNNKVENEDIYDLIEFNEKLISENKLLKEALISNQEILKDNNEILKNSVSYYKTTNIIQNNNILFNINDFGHEDLSHIENGFVEEVIQQMNTNSLIKYIEEVHYANPQNFNVIIPSSNSTMADNNMLLLKRGDRWVMDNKKNVLEDMITINIERITDVYEEINVNLTEEVQTNFQNYVSEIGNESPTKMIRDEAIQQTENMILRKQPANKFLLENARFQQNQFIDGVWKESTDTQFPVIKTDIDGMSQERIMDMMEQPSEIMMENMGMVVNGRKRGVSKKE